MGILKGGAGDCYCGCNGPSSTADNDAANNAKDLKSPGGPEDLKEPDPTEGWCWIANCYNGPSCPK